METNNGKAEAFFSKVGKKIDELFSELRDSDFAQKIDLENRLNELKKDKENLSKQFKDFNKDNEQTFNDIKVSMEESLEDIRNIFKKRKS